MICYTVSVKGYSIICSRPECDVKTDNPKYCSRSCAVIVNNRKHPKRTVEGNCKQCNESISTTRKFCSKKCYADYRPKPKRQDKESYNAYMREYMQQRYAKRRIKALEYLGNKCVKCGTSESLHFDHIDPDEKQEDIGQLLTYATTKLYAELDKCQLLCQDHHLEKTIQEGSLCNTDDDKVYHCCGKTFFGARSYIGHKGWCKKK